MAEKRVYSSLKSFGKGINSDVDCLLLPPDQLSFARNATVRGDFVTQRPNFYNLTLQGAAQDLADFQAGLFQGATYYRTNVNGYIMVAVNGKLFQITVSPSNQSATVVEVPLPSPNSPTAPQNWMWQAGPFLIWNDGINPPMFYDGVPGQVNVRRSLGPTPVLLGTVASLFTVPAQNNFVNQGKGNIQLTAPWTAGFGSVLIGSALYNVNGFSGGITSGRITVGLGSVNAAAGDLIAPNTSLLLNSKYCGSIEGATTSDGVNLISLFPPLPVDGTPGDEVVLTVLSDTGAGQASTVAIGTSVLGSKYYAGQIVSATQNGILINNYPTDSAPLIAITLSSPATQYGQLKNGASVSITLNAGIPAQNVASGIATGVVIGSPNFTLQLTSLSVAVGSAVPSTSYLRVPAGVFSSITSIGASVWPSPGVPSFIITLSQNFAGSVNDILQDSGGNTMTVLSIAGTSVTCQMTNNLQGAITRGSMMLNSTHQADLPTNYGTTIQTAVPVVAVGSNMTIPITPSSNALAVGQTVYIATAITAGGAAQITAQVSQVNDKSIGEQDNFFNLTISAAGSAAKGDNLSVGSVPTNDVATMVVTSVINPNIVQCQMTNVPNVNNLNNFITQGVPTVPQLLINVSKGNGVTTLVGTYPAYTAATPPVLEPPFTVPALATFNIGEIIPTNLPSFSYGQIVQIDLANGAVTDIFMVISTTDGSSGSQPSIVAVNMNDTQGNNVIAGTPIYSVPELPISRMGCYGMGRNWVALPDGVSYVAGDLVGASTGTKSPYNFQDSVLKVSQNYFLAGGGTFQISGAGETITAMSFVAQLDASLGQGPLQIFTDETVFSNVAPVDMTTWSALTSPIQIEGLIGSGAISQDAVVQQNNDLIFRLSNGGIQSMLMASQNFNQWGNTPISKEVSRSIKNDDPNLLQYTSMVTFNNRMLMSCQFQQATRGVYGGAMVALNFDPISSLSGKAPTVWDGEWTGLNVLQLISGTFNGSKQCYALCLSPDLTQIELHQIQLDETATQDNGVQPVAWEIESPMLFVEPENASSPRLYKRLLNGDFSVRDITGDIAYTVSYRSDQNPNWTLWYGSTIKYAGATDPGYRRRIPIGSPNPNVFDATNNQPMREGYNFQLKIEFVGSCVLTNFRAAADLIDEPEFGRVT